ncbi:MAG TPA: NFACT RNA binding domain-containing protein, partial [Candidatus Limnocylindrales bacterium]|nr:NFACT RNA binding domain-containing protein [Candidatus Limnocylindrales bacterium]
VHQPAEKEIVLTLWTGREEKRLLISADPELCRIHLSTRKVPNPPSPPRFCQFLRRHLEGMRIEGMTVAPFDRLVRLDFVATRPGALHDRTALYAELYGRHANLIYVNAGGTILEPLRAVTLEESRIREVVAGMPYRPLPRPERIFLPDFTPADAERIYVHSWEGFARVLQQEISGLGQELAREAAGLGKSGPADLFAAIREFVRRYEERDAFPGIGTLPSGKRRLLPFPCPAAGFTEFTPFPDANAAADAYYSEAAASRELATLRQQLRSRLSALLKKERHKLDNVGGDEERLAEGLKGGAYGETLKAHLQELRKGMTEYERVPLDPAKTPVENMNRYFLLHRKAKRAVDIVRKRKREVTETVYYLESLEAQLEAAKSREDLIAVRQELSQSFAPKKPRSGGKKHRRPDAPKPPVPQVDRREFAGYAILVGKNNVGNDRIVKELAAPDDLWLHAQGIPGSHILVKAQPGKDTPPDVIEEAARLAVLHSKAKGQSNVPVFLAEARHVSKFKGARPGLVRIARYRTVTVR